MAHIHGPRSWPALGPILPQATDFDPVGGHPTAAGPLDRDIGYPRLPADPTPRGNGIPGRPKYRARQLTHGKMGAMLPGPTPSGPQQPGWEYDEGEI